MAGQEIYIGKMIESMQDSMNSMEEKMTETVDVLQNILINTGLTKKQKIFTGPDLIAVNLNSPAILDVSPYQKNGTDITQYFSAEENKLNYEATENSTNYCTILLPLNFSEFEKITFDYNKTSSAYTATFSFKAGDGDVIWTGSLSTTTREGSAEVDISEITGLLQPRFRVISNNSRLEGSISSITFHRPDGTTYTLLQPAAGTLSYQDEEITPTAAGYTYGYANYADLITGVGTWDSLIFQGNADGVTFSLVDENGFEIMPLSEKSEISSLSVYNFFVRYEMTKADSFVSGVIFRYF